MPSTSACKRLQRPRPGHELHARRLARGDGTCCIDRGVQGLCHAQHAGLSQRTAGDREHDHRSSPRPASMPCSCRIWASCDLVRAICPDLPIHASTQMTLTSAESHSRWCEELGVERVVLARELSLDEIRAIREQHDMPLEVFVHGALCVAYSGQCLTSESLGGRSANRGQCAQACRLPYELICDGEDVDLGDQQYLLSPQDLAAYALVPELIDAGVSSLKIEGRLKTPEYVANITRHYRQAIDAAMARPAGASSRRGTSRRWSCRSRAAFRPAGCAGNDHKMLVPATQLRQARRAAGRGVAACAASASSVRTGRPASSAATASSSTAVDRDERRARRPRVRGVSRRRRSLTKRRQRPRRTGLRPDRLDLDAVWPAASGLEDRRSGADATACGKSFTGADPQRRVPVDLRRRRPPWASRCGSCATAAHGATAASRVAEPAGRGDRSIRSPRKLLARAARPAGRHASTNCATWTPRSTGRPMIPLSVLGQAAAATDRAARCSLDSQLRRTGSEARRPL